MRMDAIRFFEFCEYWSSSGADQSEVDVKLGKLRGAAVDDLVLHRQRVANLHCLEEAFLLAGLHMDGDLPVQPGNQSDHHHQHHHRPPPSHRLYPLPLCKQNLV